MAQRHISSYSNRKICNWYVSMSEFYSEYSFDLYDKSLSNLIYLHISNTFARCVYTENSDANNLYECEEILFFFMRVELISEYF